MRLIVETAEGTRAFSWEAYALVRDNVQHFVEYDRPNGRFQALHGIEQAVDGGFSVVDAARLRGEVLRALFALGRISLDDAALSTRTRAVMTGSTHQPAAHPTIEARDVGWALPVSTDSDAAVSIADAAASFFDAVLDITTEAVDGQLLQIRRAGTGPLFSQSGPSASKASAWFEAELLPSL